MSKKKVLIIEDHPIVREGLKQIFSSDSRFEVMDEAANGAEGLQYLKQKQYDLILLDIRMPVMNGLEFLKVYQQQGLSVPVMILTIEEDKRTVQQVLSFPVKGFLLKDAGKAEMLEAAAQVLGGETYIPAEISDLGRTCEANKNLPKSEQENPLTQQEIRILEEVVRGKASKEIACDFGITERTVKAHLTSIYRKLDVSSRTEAVTYALTRSLIVMDDPKVQ